jgi:lincosamide nucleotidyltransferase A/C/D/E
MRGGPACRGEGLDGHHFDYPPSVWTVGELDGRAVPCISVEQQRAFHSAYDPRPEDVHDLELLDQLQLGT